ncbi:MAG TPA: DsbA family oxidoreductase [Candidatus Limnocylindrales bacterium]|nr:DsbA family oxidoreductase [Candidatus Limnocylindrales bacterium]
MKVEIWSDVVCPWCYIGKRRFERALERFDGAGEVEVTWRSFQLNPDRPKGSRQSHDAYLAAKLGATIEQVQTMNQRVIGLAAAEGLDYDFEHYQVVNTFDAHRLTHLAKAQGLGAAIQERFLRAQLVEGEVLDDAATLIRLAAEVGLAADDAREVLDSDAHAVDVQDDLREARALGVNGVPFFVVDRRFGVSGAQETEVFLQVLGQAQSERGRQAVGPTP